MYQVRQKSSPLEFFCSFLRICLEFPGEILHTYVVIIYVHTGVYRISIIIHCLQIISIAEFPFSDFSALKDVRAVNDVIQTTTTIGQNSTVTKNVEIVHFKLQTSLWSHRTGAYAGGNTGVRTPPQLRSSLVFHSTALLTMLFCAKC